MKNYQPVMSFGEDVAEVYDNVQRGDEAPAVAFLEELARCGPALELAIGTGRIGLPDVDDRAGDGRTGGVEHAPAHGEGSACVVLVDVRAFGRVLSVEGALDVVVGRQAGAASGRAAVR